MNQRVLHTPEGVRDIYNEECEKKLVVQQKLHTVLNSYGYRDIETPIIEFFEVFGREVGTVPAKDLYKFFDRDGNTMVLRPDITPSVARAAAKYFISEDMPIRLCYIGNTFINHSSYQGRLKETTQLGTELIGYGGPAADGEVLALVTDLLLTAVLKEFQVSIGHAEFFRSLVEEAGIDEETELELRSRISNKNNFGVEELLREADISEELKQIFFRLPQLFGSVEILAEAKRLAANPKAQAAVRQLEEIYQILTYYQAEKYVSFDLGMLNSHDYYTGIIFQAYTFGTGDAIVKGGRYDRLLTHFGKEAPSIGFAVEVNQLLNALDRQRIPVPVTHNNTLVLAGKEEFSFAVALTRHFRRQKLKVELLLKERELSDYLEYAKRIQAGGILYLEGNHAVQVIDVNTGSVQTADLTALMNTQG